MCLDHGVGRGIWRSRDDIFFSVIVALATMSHLSYCSDRHVGMPVSPCDLGCTMGLGEREHRWKLRSVHRGSDGEESLKTCACGRGRLVEMRRRISQILHRWARCLQTNVVWITRLSIQQLYQHISLVTVVVWILCKTVFSVEMSATKWKYFLCPRTQKVCYGGQ